MTAMLQRSQNLLDPFLVALDIMKGWLNLCLLIIRYVLNIFVHQLITKMMPLDAQALMPMAEKAVNRAEFEPKPISHDDWLSASDERRGFSGPNMLSKLPCNARSGKTKFTPGRNNAPDVVFGKYTTELLFGREQSNLKQNHTSSDQVDVVDAETTCVQSISRLETAKSLKTLIGRLGASGSSGEETCLDEKISSDVIPSLQPCWSLKNIYSAKSLHGPKKNNAVVNLRNCNLRVVKEVVRKLGLKETTAHTREWDVYWTSYPISVMKCKTFKRYQRTNHFPESSRPLLKNNLAKYLTRMSSKYPKEYDFFPESWCLPEEYVCLEAHTLRYPNQWFIVKPYNCSSGHGIFITKDLKELNNCGKMVCQAYIQRPLLIDGYKFDLRIYVLVTSCKPLRIFVYNEGFVRLGTERYQSPSHRNEKRRRMHLTNYSVNKYSPNCVIDAEKGTLRKLSSFSLWLTERGIDPKSIIGSMDDVIIKTTVAFAPVLSHYYCMSFPDQTESNSCFQIFGFDIMFDENLKPYVLEVNTDPSLYADIQMERELKEELVLDTFNILNLAKKPRRTVWLNTPKSRSINSLNDRKLTQSRIDWENSHMGNYRKIYPNDNTECYQDFLKMAKRIANSI